MIGDIMRRIQAVLIVVATILFATAFSFGQAPTDQFKTGKIYGSDIYSSTQSDVLAVKVSPTVSGATILQLPAFAGRGNDYYNTGFKLRAVKCTNVTSGTIYDITDYVSSTGTFTVTTADGNWVSGDQVQVITDEVAFSVYGFGTGAGAVATGKVTACTNSTTISSSVTVSEFSGLNTALIRRESELCPAL
jgi:hypothetical protein